MRRRKEKRRKCEREKEMGRKVSGEVKRKENRRREGKGGKFSAERRKGNVEEGRKWKES